MLSFFPASFPDELLYSLLARYHRLSGHVDDRLSLQELVGHHTHVITSHLPSGLHALASIIPGDRVRTADQFIVDSTVLPYFCHFLSEDQVSRAKAAMAGDSVVGVKMLLGLLASRVGGKNTFRFCNQCRQHDENQFGQSYWHRVHQLPGVWICPAHRVGLMEIDTGMTELKRHRLLLPDDSLIRAHAKEIAIPDYQADSLWRLSRLSQQALLATSGLVKGGDWNGVYRARAKALGFIGESGRIRTDDLVHAIKGYLAAVPDSGEFGFAQLNGQFHWAFKLLRRPRKSSSHPLKHLLLLDCLQVDLSTGKSMGCARGGKPALSSATSRTRGKYVDPELLSRLICANGYSLRRSATELGISTTTVRLEAARLGIAIDARPKKITTTVYQAVLQALMRGSPLAMIAAVHAISLPSVYRILRMNPAVAQAYKQMNLERQRNVRRKRFVKETADVPVNTCKDYFWLRRNDCNWLANYVASGRNVRGTRSGSTVNWEERDHRLSADVKAVNERILYAHGKPQRASRAALGRGVGKMKTIERNAKKLPLTHAMLSECSESIEQFQHRRLLWAAEQLRQQHLPCSSWRLLRLAGIRKVATSDIDLLCELLTGADAAIGINHRPPGTRSPQQGTERSVFDGTSM